MLSWLGMLTCKQASKLVSQSLDRQLTTRERFALRFHLLICAACARFSRQLALMESIVRKLIADAEQDDAVKLPQSARERMIALMQSKAVETGLE